MKHTHWLLVLLPPTLICLLVWTQTRISPHEYRTRLWHLSYYLDLEDTLPTSSFFHALAAEALAQAAKEPETVDQFEAALSQELLDQLKADGVFFPPGAELFYTWDRGGHDPSLEFPGITLHAVTSIPAHKRLKQLYEHTQTGKREHIQHQAAAPDGAWRERAYEVPQIWGKPWVIKTLNYWELGEDPPRPVRLLRIQKQSASRFPHSSDRLFRLGRLTIRKDGLFYSGPLIPYLFPLLTAASLFLYVLRKPFLRLLRLPTRPRPTARRP